MDLERLNKEKHKNGRVKNELKRLSCPEINCEKKSSSYNGLSIHYKRFHPNSTIKKTCEYCPKEK